MASRGRTFFEVHVDATAYVCLDDVETSDLIDEIKSRGLSVAADEQLAELLRARGWDVRAPEHLPSTAASLTNLAALHAWLARNGGRNDVSVAK